MPVTYACAHCTPNRERTPSRPLVGKNCLIHCHIQSKEVQALWDSGSQVTIVDEVWKEINLPHTTLRDVSEILDRVGPFYVVAANGENMPYMG